MPNTLCDAVLICTMYCAHSATASVIGCVILAKFLKFLRLVEDHPLTCCAKHIKTRSNFLYCLASDLSRLPPYLFAVVG